MAHHKNKRTSAARRVLWVGVSIAVLLVAAASLTFLRLRPSPVLTPQPSQAALRLDTSTPTQTATPTPLPSPTRTSTSFPSATPGSPSTAGETLTPAVRASSTLAPPPSATPSPTLALPTSTLLPSPRALSPSAAPRPTPTTPSPTAVYAEPALIEPQEGSAHSGAVTFRWHSVGALQPGDLYDVRAWRGEEELGVGRTSTTELVVRDPSLAQDSGQYRWRVVVIRIVGSSDPHKDWEIVSPLPDARTFFWGRDSEAAPEDDGG